MFLCQTCKAMKPVLKFAFKDEFHTVHHESYKSLMKAAKEGCHICSAVWPTLKFKSDPDTVLAMRPATFCSSADVSGYPLVSISGNHRLVNGNEPEGLEVFQTFPDTSYRHVTTDIPVHTSSEECFRRMKAWLGRCLASHARCKRVPNPSWSPTRLVAVGATGTNPRFIDTGNKAVASYATLSHCWGGIPILRLTVDTFESFYRGIPFEELSKTFQDAIEVTRRLTIDYIWIDSLCIIQRTEEGKQAHDEDWTRESAMMGEVYRNGILNISATGASNGNDGLYFTRNPNAVGPLISCPRFQMDATSFRETDRYKNLLMVNANFWQDLCVKSPAFTRGWIFQERLLSRRVLHFGKEQVFWECCVHECCETFPDMLPVRLQEETFQLLKSVYSRFQERDFTEAFTTGFLFHVQNRSIQEIIEVFWETIVTDYSKCALSCSGDKLVALAGVARDVARIRTESGMEAEYIAGLWKSDLPHALLWYGPHHVVRSKVYRSPTWSWASTDGTIWWNDATRSETPSNVAANVLSMHTSLYGHCFGEVRGASMQLEATIWDLEIMNTQSGIRVMPTGIVNQQALEQEDDTDVSLALFLDEDGKKCDKPLLGLVGVLIVSYDDTTIIAPSMLALIPVSRHQAYERVGIVYSGTGFSNKTWKEGGRNTVINLI